MRMIKMWLRMPCLLIMLLFSSLLCSSLSKSEALIPHSCPDKCGKVSVPYPFGVGNVECARDPKFLLDCKNGRPLLFGRIPVRGISLEGTVTVTMETKGKRYDDTTEVTFYGGIDLRRSPFRFSTSNRLVVVGCNVTALLTGNGKYRRGCFSFCDEDPGYGGGQRLDYQSSNTCSGIGCCQTSMANRIRSLNLTFITMNDDNDDGDSPAGRFCLHAFLESNVSTTSLNASVLSKPQEHNVTSEVILDWVAGDEYCQTATNIGSKTTYACGENTHCSDSTNGHGYRCFCKQGFQGNPYLPHGCQDINECEHPDQYTCSGICKNTVGNYTCSCPKGFQGDPYLPHGCQDINECDDPRGNPCEGYCQNTLGGFTCMNRSTDVIDDQEFSRRHTGKIVAILAISLSMGFLLFITAIYWLYHFLRKKKIIQLKKKFFKRNGGLLLQQQISSDKCKLEKLKIFSSEELEKATDYYNEDRILGKGGQGTVYKGMLPDGNVVAVKKSEKMDEAQTEHFINEVVILSQINHRHVVKLLGCCLETEVPLLVYELISNGTLSEHLHDQMDEPPMKWSDRLRIAKDVAGAIAYMHSAVDVPIYHRDIKSSNILLDGKCRAKLSDFGISRSVPTEKTHLTTSVQGTFGYLDPEYFQSNQYTEKSDVYSFGVVLVELLTRQKPTSNLRSEYMGLVAYFISSVKENRLSDVLDPQIVAEGEKEEIVMLVNLAMRCLKLNGRKRPTMQEICWELENLKSPNQHLPLEVSYQEDDYFFMESSRSILDPPPGDESKGIRDALELDIPELLNRSTSSTCKSDYD